MERQEKKSGGTVIQVLYIHTYFPEKIKIVDHASGSLKGNYF